MALRRTPHHHRDFRFPTVGDADVRVAAKGSPACTSPPTVAVGDSPHCSSPALLPALLLALAAGWAVASAPSADTLIATQRVAARLDAAAALALAGVGGEALALVEDARSRAEELPSQAAGVAGLRSAAEAAARAAGVGDASALRTAARRGADAAAAALAARADDEAGAQALAALVRDVEREAAEAGRDGDAAAPALARALAARARSMLAVLPLPDAATAALDGLDRGLADEPVDAAKVERATDALLASLGTAPAADRTARYLSTIRADLATAVSAYRRGDAAAAEDRLIDAYLENFEYLEAPLEAVDHDLMEDLEHALRDDLRAMLRSGAPTDAFERAVRAVVSDLARAEAALR